MSSRGQDFLDCMAVLYSRSKAIQKYIVLKSMQRDYHWLKSLEQFLLVQEALELWKVNQLILSLR